MEPHERVSTLLTEATDSAAYIDEPTFPQNAAKPARAQADRKKSDNGGAYCAPNCLKSTIGKEDSTCDHFSST